MYRIILTTVFMFVLNNLVQAQTESRIQITVDTEDFAIAQAMVSKTKKALITEHMGIDHSPENSAFWKLYDQYESHRKVIIADRVQLLRAYLDQYYSLDDPKAATLTADLMDNYSRMNDLDKKYFKSFKKLIGGLQASTLFQIEMYIQTAMQMNVQTQTPIIGELQKLEAEMLKSKI